MLIWCFLATIARASEIPVALYSNESIALKSAPKPKTDEDEIHFLLYTRNNSDKFQEIKISNTESLLKSDFNYNQSSKIIIHGWISNNGTMTAIEELKNAYLNNTNYNVIVVDWTKLASGAYKTAHGFAHTVTAFVIEFIILLMKHGVSVTQLHLVGHSIGAHIAGNVGRYFREHQNRMIDAITGLDPAYPLYKFSSKRDILNRDDAQHVEVVHSNSGFWGYRTPLGHVDFYPNGGRVQPGCRRDLRELCAHDRALQYYTYSITGTKFNAVRFKIRERVHYSKIDTLYMNGLKLNYGQKGNYWFRTGHRPPFIFNPDDFQDDKMDARYLKELRDNSEL